MQRRLIVEKVSQRHEHFDADQLAAEMAQSRGARKVSRPTVYRHLNKLKALDILEGDDLHSVNLSDGSSEIFIGTHGRKGVERFFLGSVGGDIAVMTGDDISAARDAAPALRARGFRYVAVDTAAIAAAALTPDRV